MSINLVLPYQVCCVLYIDRLVSAPLVSITFTRSSNLYELLVSILNNKKKERLSTFLWQLLCMMPLWSTQVQLIEQLSTYTLSSEEALTEIWAQIFPEDIYICNYNMTILEWKISRDYELFYNRDVYYKGTTKEQEGKDLTLFILMMVSFSFFLDTLEIGLFTSCIVPCRSECKPLEGACVDLSGDSI